MKNNIINWIKSNKVIVIFLIIGAFLRLFHLDFQSVWLDEIHTLNESNPEFSFQEVYSTLLIAEPHPPLYFFIMNIVFKIFGYTTLVARLFSAFIGIAGIYTIYLLGKELYSKKVGIYAMILLSVNYFHIYYSQDARMYVLLFFTTTLSFYFLTKLLKNPTIKNTIIFSVVSTLMIYSHFFFFFSLIAQYLILLYFIIFPFKVTRIKFLKYMFISGIITVLLYIPTYKLILKTTQMKSIWIEMPGLDVYTQFYKDFFGQSELVLFFTIPILLLYFIKLFDISETKHYSINPNEDKLKFSFIILFTWIFITLLIPLIRTYTSLPMLVNRYFINILPAILIILAIGLCSIKNKIIKKGIILIIFIFSITDLFIVKSYYNKATKTQFREGSNFIIENNKNNSKVVTSLGWYFNYFLNNDKVKYKVIDKSLENYIEEIKQDTTNLDEFWYIDAHNSPYRLSESSEKFLEKNFSIENNVDLIDCWAKFYVKKTNEFKVINMSQFDLKNKLGTSNINYWIESFIIENNEIKVNGWAYLKNQDAYLSKIRLILIEKEIAYELPVEMNRRIDITKSDRTGYNYDNSGFAVKIATNKLKKGEYKIGIFIKSNNKQEFVLTDKTFLK